MRGQITIQLTWLFAAIAGIAVFIFIMNFISTQGNTSEFTMSAAVLEHIDTELRIVAKTQKSFKKIPIPNTKLRVVCPERETSGIMLFGSETFKNTRYQAIFSPEYLEGRELFVWNTDWVLPSNADNFLFLGNPDLLFVIVKDGDGHWQTFNSTLAENFNRVVVDHAEAVNFGLGGYDNYKFVFFNRAYSSGSLGINQLTRVSLKKLVGKKISAVNFQTTTENLREGGNIEFYNFADKLYLAGTSFYYDLPLVLGGAFAEDVVQYECNLDKSLFKIMIQGKVNYNRTVELMLQLANNDPLCEAWIPNQNNALPSTSCNECLLIMKTLPEKYDDIIQSAQNRELEILVASALEIGAIGNDLAKGDDCPTL